MTAALLLLGLVAAADDSGWRAGGDGVATGPLPDLGAPAWEVPLPRWGNASPVRFRDQICVTLEPTTLACFDAETGAEQWRAPHDVVQAVAEPQRSALAAALDAATRAESERRTLLAERSRLQRAARAGDTSAQARADAIGARLVALDATIAAAADARTPDDQDVLGWATPTPVTDGRALYALFANGVVARHEPDGRVAWMRWLGPPQRDMRGFHTGESTSPVLVDGVLVVAHVDLVGLDPATGTDRWRVPGWRDYGTPVVVPGADGARLATPDGRLVRARDGVVVARDLADVWYVGPHARGDRVVWFGSTDPEVQRAARSVPVTLVVGDRRAWSVTVATDDTFYSAPTATAQHVFSVTKTGELRVLELATGAVVHTADLLPKLGGWVWASPVVVETPGRPAELVVVSASGRVLRLATTAPFGVLGEHAVTGSLVRATPAFAPGRLWVRASDRLACYGCAPR